MNDALFKMMGIDPQIVNQLMLVKSKLDLLPKDKQIEIINSFIESLETAVEEQKNGSK